MAGPIQTAINQILGSVAGGIALGKKLKNDEGQADKKKQEISEEQAEGDKEAAAVATEADLIGLGASETAAKAYRLAQERGTASPERIVFDENGKPLATYNEIASLLASQSLSNSYTSKLRSKQAVKIRKQMLEGRSHEERVQNAVLAQKGGK